MKMQVCKTELWDNIAGRFNSYPEPSWENDPFLLAIEDLGLCDREMTVLEIGCGAGQYALAMSKRFKKVIAIDPSIVMINYSEERKEKSGVENIEFHQCDWYDAEASQKYEDTKYDLVVSHQCPGVCDEETLKRMINSTNIAGIYSSHVRREESLKMKVYEKLSLKKPTYPTEGPLEVLKSFWGLNIFPKVVYESRESENMVAKKISIAEYSSAFKEKGYSEEYLNKMIEIVNNESEGDYYLSRSIMTNVFMSFKKPLTNI